MPACFIASRSAVIPSLDTLAEIQYQKTHGCAASGGFLKFSSRSATVFASSILPRAADELTKGERPVASAIKVPVPVFFINFLLFHFVFILAYYNFSNLPAYLFFAAPLQEAHLSGYLYLQPAKPPRQSRKLF